MFFNRFSFLHMEQDYFHEGGAHNSETYYLFTRLSQEDSLLPFWRLNWVVTGFRAGGKPGFVADLGSSFEPIDLKLLQSHSSEYEMKFFQKECMQYLDEYMMIDGVHLVKRVASTDNFKFNRI